MKIYLQKACFLSSMILIAAICGGYANPNLPEHSGPAFFPGEKLTYDLRWGIFHAGEATLEVAPMDIINHRMVYHFVMTVRTNSFLDNFYKVRDRIDAYADTDMKHSIFFRKKQREGSHKRDIVVNFDWDNHRAQYSNFGDKNAPISLMPGTFDPLSAFYFSRMVEMKEKQTIERPVTDGKKNVIGRVKVVKRETVKVGEKEYDTFLVEPELKHVKGVFEKSDGATLQIWITADERRIPVKVSSKVAVGSFVGELASATYAPLPGKKFSRQAVQNPETDAVPSQIQPDPNSTTRQVTSLP